jgi:hypothetical protein
MPNFRDYDDDQADPRIDALDVIEGVLKDGFSLSNFSRIARARGPNFWIGAAIGATAVVLLSKPETRAAIGAFFRAGTPSGSPQGHSADKGESASAPSSKA